VFLICVTFVDKQRKRDWDAVKITNSQLPGFKIIKIGRMVVRNVIVIDYYFLLVGVLNTRPDHKRRHPMYTNTHNKFW